MIDPLKNFKNPWEADGEYAQKLLNIDHILDRSDILKKGLEKIVPQNNIKEKGYIVYIYGPYESERFQTYYKNNEVVAQRTMLYYAMNTEFSDEGKQWINKQTYIDEEKPPRNRAVEVLETQKFEGVLVIMAQYMESNFKYITYNDNALYFPLTNDLYKDKFYPIDVKVLDKNYYKDSKGNDLDFFGFGLDVNFTFGSKILYQGSDIYTYTKGIGFRKFKVTLKETADIYNAGADVIAILGKYKSDNIEEQINQGVFQIWGEYEGQGDSFTNGYWTLNFGKFIELGIKSPRLPNTVDTYKKVVEVSSRIVLSPYEIDQTVSKSRFVNWKEFLKK